MLFIFLFLIISIDYFVSFSKYGIAFCGHAQTQRPSLSHFSGYTKTDFPLTSFKAPGWQARTQCPHPIQCSIKIFGIFFVFIFFVLTKLFYLKTYK